MSKSAKRSAFASRKVAAIAKSAPRSMGNQPSAKPAQTSKQSRVIAMLQAPKGATIEAMIKATGWQQHSIRGFLAGVIRKRLKLKLSSDVIQGTRVYRIAVANKTNDRSKPV